MHLRNLVPSIAASVMFVGLSMTPTSADAIEIEKVTSPGGITAWLVEDYTNPLIAMNFAFKGAGSTQDLEGKGGTATLMSGLLDEGAGEIESREFQTKLNDLGVSLSYDAGLDNFLGNFRTITEFRDDAFELLRLSVNEPRFDTEPVERIRGQILTGIRASQNDPEEVASETFRETVFGGHPYSRPTEGTLETLPAVTADDLRAFRERTFAKDNLVVGVVGAISPEELGQRLDEVFGDLPEKADLKPIPEAEPTIGVVESAELNVPQTSIRMALPGVKRDDEDFFAAYLMNHILGGGTFSSRLYQEIREKRGLAYGAGSYLGSYDHGAILGIYTATRADAAPESIEIIRNELNDMAENGPTAEELEKAKAYVKGSYAIGNLDSSLAIASTLVGIQLDDLGIDYIDRRGAEIDAVTLDEVREEARELLSPDPTVVTVGPAGA